MALTSAQMTKVVQLLGYGGKSIQAGSVIYDKVMNDRLHALPPDTEALVVGYLTSVAALELQISQAPARLAASKVQDLEMNKHELQDLRAERKRISRELAYLLDIPYQAPNSVNVGLKV